jgi:hypothetical protein
MRIQRLLPVLLLGSCLASVAGIAADCESAADLIAGVDSTQLPDDVKAKLNQRLTNAQDAIDQAATGVRVTHWKLRALRNLAGFVKRLNKSRDSLDALAFTGMKACAWSLAETVRARDLVAYYPFNGDARDHSGQGLDGTVVGASFETYGNPPRAALRFAGTDSSYVVVPRAGVLEPTEALTISMWCKGVPGQPCGFGWGTILRKADHCEPGYHIRGCNGGTAFQVDPANPCSEPLSKTASFLTFTGTVWQHIVGVYSRAEGTLKTYEDGALVDQTAYGAALLHTGDLYIGGAAVSAFGDDGGFDGLISDVRIYRRPLSAKEVRQLYEATLH